MKNWIKGLIVPVLAIFAVVVGLGLANINSSYTLPTYETVHFTVELPAVPVQETCNTYSPDANLSAWKNAPELSDFAVIELGGDVTKKFFELVEQEVPGAKGQIQIGDFHKVQLFWTQAYADTVFAYTYTEGDCGVWEIKIKWVTIQEWLDAQGLKWNPNEPTPTAVVTSLIVGDGGTVFEKVGSSRYPWRLLDLPSPAHPGMQRS